VSLTSSKCECAWLSKDRIISYLDEYGYAVERPSRPALTALVIQQLSALKELMSKGCGDDGLQPAVVGINLLEVCGQRMDRS